MKKTKIVATIGPASWDEPTLQRMIDSGMNVARINASFADHQELKEVSQKIRKLSNDVAIMLDLKGHKIRVNDFGDPIEIKAGQDFSLFTHMTEGKIHIVSEGSLELENQLEPNTVILLDDGNIKLQLKEIRDSQELVCKVIQGGSLQRGKTINIPGVHLNFPPISEKDYNDILFGVEEGFDFIAASFVRNVHDLEEIAKLTQNANIQVISKIEDSEGVQNYDDILEHSDGIMVARGDLGVEIAAQRIPELQKEFIKKANLKGKPVIVATQMLESMRENISPTRAEVADVANAIYDGTDGVMLSAETSTGKHPVEAVIVMRDIALETEEEIDPRTDLPSSTLAKPTTNAIAKAVMNICNELPVDKILVATGSGNTARNLARYYPRQHIYAFTENDIFKRRLALTKGVTAAVLEGASGNRDLGVTSLVENALKHGFVTGSDLVVVVAGANIMGQGATNMLEVQRVSHFGVDPELTDHHP